MSREISSYFHGLKMQQIPQELSQVGITDFYSCIFDYPQANYQSENEKIDFLKKHTKPALKKIIYDIVEAL